jgi:hypothetical protein
MGDVVSGATTGTGTGEGTGITDQSGQIGDMLSGYTPDESDDKSERGDEGDKTGTGTGEAGKGREGAGVSSEEGKAVSAEDEGETDPIKALTATVQALNAKIATLEAGKTTKGPEPVEEPAKPDIFIKDRTEYDALFEQPELLNEVLNKVAEAGGTRVLKAMPKIIRAVVKQQIEMQTSTAKFFTDNKDLLPHRQFASFVANDLIGQNPNWTLPQLYEKLGGEVRTRLGLKAGATATVGKGKGTGTGAFPGTKGTGARQVAGQSGKLTPIEQEIKDLID